MLLSDIQFSKVVDTKSLVVVGNPRPRFVFDNGKVTDTIDGYMYPLSDGVCVQTVFVSGNLRKFGRYEAVALVRPRFTYVSKTRELMAAADDIQGVGKNG